MAFTDAFTNANGTLLPIHNAAWVTPSGANTLVIASNAAVGNTGGAFNLNYYNATFADAHYAKGVFHASIDNYAGVAVRVQSGANSCYYAVWDPTVPGKVITAQLIAGTPTTWDSGQTGFSPGDTVELRIDATTPTTVYLYRGTTLVQTYTGKSALSGGRPGVICYGQLNAALGLDSWEGGDVVAASVVISRPIYVT